MIAACARRAGLVVAAVVALGCPLHTDRRPEGGQAWASSAQAEERTAGGTATFASGIRVELRPEEGPVVANSDKNWLLIVTSANGEPLYPIRARVDGGMPQHGHGLPTSPRVTRYLGDGRYRVEGLRFNMPGAWKMRISLDGPSGPEVAEMDLEVEL